VTRSVRRRRAHLRMVSRSFLALRGNRPVLARRPV